ncbi:uncharacterized protein MYCGRDRAFT_62778, partial [Zymoseptoria tritici IPO323]
MDATLHCNAIKCRAECLDQAVVTTCSHIFCLRCADDLGLTNPKDGHRICPACSAQLELLDDAVCTSLNPSEDYKTSILSGLSPTIIMDCVSRGLGFWSYQMSQEINYQQFLGKKLTQSYRSISEQLDSNARQANEDIQRLNEKIEGLTLNLHDVERKHQRLHGELQKTAEQLKQCRAVNRNFVQKNNVAGLEAAAEHDAEHVLQ